ncbi:MAG: M36 family metallopeptidase [Saprospiraceae bacterium]|nr:M36 family metallopeptidase [Saprospiraceae bacterium]
MRKTISLFIFLSLLIFEMNAQNFDELIGDHLLKNEKKYGLNKSDLKTFRLEHVNNVNRNGAVTYYYQQQINDIDIQNAMLIVTLDKNNKIVHIGNSAIGHLNEVVVEDKQAISAPEAAVFAARNLGIKNPETPGIHSRTNAYPDQLEQTSYTKSPIGAVKKYIFHEGKLFLTHQLTMEMAEGADYWQIAVDATTGNVIQKFNHTLYCRHSDKKYAHSENCFSPVKQINVEEKVEMAGTSAYKVIPFPYESPNHGAHVLVTDPAFPEASPFGWHDTNGAAGPEFTTTRGNNVNAFADKDDNDFADIDTPSPDGGDSLVFNYDLFQDEEPLANANASITNLFYATNMMHDLTYLYGFDEVSGNFQFKNYSNMGRGNDHVNANALDGMSITDPDNFNNANFTTPTDGNPGKMQMYIWDRASSAIQVTEPEDIGVNISEYGLPSGWAGPIPEANQTPVIGNLALAIDNSSSPTRLCNPAVNDLSGKIAIVDRGECDFSEKAYNVQQKGAVGCFICNASGINGGNGDELLNMAGGDFANLVNIPALFLKKSDCDKLKNLLSRQIEINIKLQTPQMSGPRYLDASFDNGIIAHEYGHGISNRLTGGPGNTSCLNNDEQMGEGWSDFFALAFTVRPGDDGKNPRGIGTYAASQAITGFGIRRYPYSTDLNVNPQQFDDIKGTSAPHPLGEVWTDMLWDYFWLMADKHGFDPDLKNINSGNGMAIQTVIEALKIQGCSPGFIEGREALIAADQILFEGENNCLIWEAFARRGLGFYSDGGSANDRNDGIQDNEPLPTCIEKLKITKVMPAVTIAGADIVVTLKTINHIKAKVTGVFVEDIIPEGASYKEGSSNFPPTVVNDRIRFEIGDMEYEQEKEIVYQITAPIEKSQTLAFYDIDGGTEGFDIELNEGFDTWDLTDTGAKSGQLAFFIANIAEANDHSLYIPTLKIEGEKPVLRFFHKYDTEASYDGGIVQFSRDGGNTWSVASKDMFLRNAPNSIISYNTLPIPSLFGFSGSSGGKYIDSYIDLEPYKGEDLRFRFRFVSDSAAAAPDGGWFIDDIELMDVKYAGSLACINDQTLDKENCTTERLIIINSDVALSNKDKTIENFEMVMSPNPTDGIINVSLKSLSKQQAYIYIRSIDGRVLHQFSRTLYSETNHLTLDMSSLSSGIYLMDVQTESNGKLVQKFIKL